MIDIVVTLLELEYMFVKVKNMRTSLAIGVYLSSSFVASSHVDIFDKIMSYLSADNENVVFLLVISLSKVIPFLISFMLLAQRSCRVKN